MKDSSSSKPFYFSNYHLWLQADGGLKVGSVLPKMCGYNFLKLDWATWFCAFSISFSVHWESHERDFQIKPSPRLSDAEPFYRTRSSLPFVASPWCPLGSWGRRNFRSLRLGHTDRGCDRSLSHCEKTDCWEKWCDHSLSSACHQTSKYTLHINR